MLVLNTTSPPVSAGRARSFPFVPEAVFERESSFH